MSERETNIEIEVSINDCRPWDKVKEYYQDKELSVLEIGVYKASQIRAAKSKCNIKTYVGIDPYMGDNRDSYKGAYWKNEVEAFKIYKQSKKIFEENGGELLKTTSEIYYRSIEEDVKFDVIYIDGDHRFDAALKDMIHWWLKLEKGGVMIIDDYANPDTPDVTRAVNIFLEMYQKSIEFVDEATWSFKNKGKHIPVFNKRILVFKENELEEDYNNKKLYIWGTGKIAESCVKNWGTSIEWIGVLDNYKKDLKEWNSIPYCEISEVSKEDSMIIVATDIYYDEIRNQLCNIGFEENVNFLKYSLFLYVFGDRW